jgi:leucyl/phenylalanyl-tRNA--protein transferase
MPVFALTEELIFPDPSLAEPEGLLAVGGDLSPQRLLLGYANGIFPWYDDKTPILWWSPDPRLVLIPSELRVSRSLRQSLRKKGLRITADEDFEAVISHCAGMKRKHEKGTWITPEMKSAYIRLHRLGFAHSIEVSINGLLAGGLYGVSLGGAFFGESMFHVQRDASKAALAALCGLLRSWDFAFIDSQVHTAHLVSLGAIEVSRDSYLEMLDVAMGKETRTGSWRGCLEGLRF